MSKAKYPNRDTLNQALDHYLDAMFQFVSECLDEPSIRETLRLLSVDDLRKEIAVKDIADLIKKYWSKSFKAKFKIIDRDDIRYYDARSVTSLIIEGRNQVSHQRLRELDAEFTRSQLFLIAEVLGQIKRSDARREVETIRDELFEDTAAQLVTAAVETEKAKYKKSIAEVEKRLAAAEKDNEKLSKAVDGNAAELDKKKGELEKLSGQLVSIRSSEKENKKQFDSTAKQLEQAQAAHSTYEARLTSTETERDDYKRRLETASEQLDEVNERLSITSDQFLAVKAERDTSTEHLAAMQQLLTASTISDQSVFPPLKTDSAVRILDRRNVNKQNYLLNLLEQKQPTIIYVQSEEMVELLLKRVVPEKADVIGKCDERTSESEETEILGKLEKGELIAVVSNTTFSTVTLSHCVEHFVFCHLVPGLDEFFRQCEPAFASKKNAYLHLIYNSEQDIDGLTQKYPNRETLVEMYRKLKKLAGANGDFIKTENAYSELDIEKPSIETGLAIFAELQLLERNGEIIKFLPSVNTDLNKSTLHRRGEKLKEETADFQAFQLERSIEQIWEEMLERLDVDSERILRESNTLNYDAAALKDFQTQSEQSTEVVESDSTVSSEDTETSQVPKPTRTNPKVPVE